MAFLASDEAADVNGQNFVVFGGSVWVMKGWQPAGSLKRDSGWTPKELADNKGELFKGIELGAAPLQLLLGAAAPRTSTRTRERRPPGPGTLGGGRGGPT